MAKPLSERTLAGLPVPVIIFTVVLVGLIAGYNELRVRPEVVQVHEMLEEQQLAVPTIVPTASPSAVPTPTVTVVPTRKAVRSVAPSVVTPTR